MNKLAPPILVRKALRIKPVRFFIAAAGITLSAILVLSLASAIRSATLSFEEYISQPGADLWVAPLGTDNLVRSSAILPLSYIESFLTVPGVVSVDPIVRAFVNVTQASGREPEKNRLTLVGIGYRAPDGLGGPPRFFVGRSPVETNEVALDRAAARRLGVSIGDTISVGQRHMIISGLTKGTNLVVTQFIFGNLDASSSVSGYSGYASFLIVRVKPELSPSSVATELKKRFSDIEVFDQATFIENNSREAAAGYIPILALIYILGISAGAILVGLLIHGLIEERRDELAVVLALGIKETWLWIVVGWQGLRLSCIGAIAGSGMSIALSMLLDLFYPVIPVRFGLKDVAETLVLFGFAGLIAAVIPIMRLRSLDPLEAFRP